MNYHDHFFELPLVLSLKTPTKTDIQVVIVANTSTRLTRWTVMKTTILHPFSKEQSHSILPAFYQLFSNTNPPYFTSNLPWFLPTEHHLPSISKPFATISRKKRSTSSSSSNILLSCSTMFPPFSHDFQPFSHESPGPGEQGAPRRHGEGDQRQRQDVPWRTWCEWNMNHIVFAMEYDSGNMVEYESIGLFHGVHMGLWDLLSYRRSWEVTFLMALMGWFVVAQQELPCDLLFQ